jgi:hypothetical protein
MNERTACHLSFQFALWGPFVQKSSVLSRVAAPDAALFDFSQAPWRLFP